MHLEAAQQVPAPAQRPRLILARWRGPASPRPPGVPATPRPEDVTLAFSIAANNGWLLAL
ncbi:MAG TPA: hypothetical protein VEX11_19870 [Acetobacteraceae bacterium]|nr:hypothetical protein [Acetobacteraceae bacterium]